MIPKIRTVLHTKNMTKAAKTLSNKNARGSTPKRNILNTLRDQLSRNEARLQQCFQQVVPSCKENVCKQSCRLGCCCIVRGLQRSDNVAPGLTIAQPRLPTHTPSQRPTTSFGQTRKCSTIEPCTQDVRERSTYNLEYPWHLDLAGA